MGIYDDWVALHPGVDVHRATNIEWVLKILSIFCPYHVNDILLSTNAENPGGRYPGTTWIVWGKGRVPVGVDPADTDFMGSDIVGGSKTHKLTTAELPAHNHAVTGGAHTHTVNAYLKGSGSGGNNKKSGRDDYGSNANRTSSSTSHSHTVSSTGSNTPHNNLQPYITCYMWKRTS